MGTGALPGVKCDRGDALRRDLVKETVEKCLKKFTSACISTGTAQL